MRRSCWIVSLASALLVAGCLYTDEPLGDPAVFEPGEWDGLWICSTGGEVFRVTIDPDSGQPYVAPVLRDGNGVIQGTFARVRQRGEWLFEDDCGGGRLTTGKPCVYWHVARRVEETVLIYVADPARIRRLLDEGKVVGRIEIVPPWTGVPDRHEENVVLHSVTPEHYKALLNPATGAFALTEEQCIRLPAELDPRERAK